MLFYLNTTRAGPHGTWFQRFIAAIVQSNERARDRTAASGRNIPKW